MRLQKQTLFLIFLFLLISSVNCQNFVESIKITNGFAANITAEAWYYQQQQITTANEKETIKVRATIAPRVNHLFSKTAGNYIRKLVINIEGKTLDINVQEWHAKAVIELLHLKIINATKYHVLGTADHVKAAQITNNSGFEIAATARYRLDPAVGRYEPSPAIFNKQIPNNFVECFSPLLETPKIHAGLEFTAYVPLREITLQINGKVTKIDVQQKYARGMIPFIHLVITSPTEYKLGERVVDEWCRRVLSFNPDGEPDDDIEAIVSVHGSGPKAVGSNDIEEIISVHGSGPKATGSNGTSSNVFLISRVVFVLVFLLYSLLL